MILRSPAFSLPWIPFGADIERVSASSIVSDIRARPMKAPTRSPPKGGAQERTRAASDDCAPRSLDPASQREARVSRNSRNRLISMLATLQLFGGSVSRSLVGRLGFNS